MECRCITMLRTKSPGDGYKRANERVSEVAVHDAR
jgi:hypothetical protein